MEQYICIHGHFYQPPRENPWLEDVEIEDSAYPYHDWNERITAECYAPNASSRILDSNKKIIDIVNNYSRISFNFGPTLLSWLEKKSPDLYDAILEADILSQNRFSGHGSAIAQIYNHLIMPLASERDKRTEVLWGIADFKKRFMRDPEGMWLSETAVDMKTLEILAENGIRFTILSPAQAARIRKIGDSVWSDVHGGVIDVTRPYLCRLNNGLRIVVFFYERKIADELSFGNLLTSGEQFARRLTDYASHSGGKASFLNIATDGETYGHHHRFGDMALSYALYLIEKENHTKISIYGEYLEKYPPEYEVEIRENTSWSCPHGVDRWRADCGCFTRGTIMQPFQESFSPGGGSQSVSVPGGRMQQRWRSPLRDAMNHLRDDLARIFETKSQGLLKDPWKTRDEYIEVILDRSEENIQDFLIRHVDHPPSDPEMIIILKLLEMQRNSLLMFTSCGWFFEEISGIETVQVMRYACRAMQLAKELTGEDLEPEFRTFLVDAPSNIRDFQNGDTVYQVLVSPMIVNPLRIGSHYAIYSLVENCPDSSNLCVYRITREDYQRSEGGTIRLATGRILLHSDITFEETSIAFAVLHLGDHNFIGGVWEHSDEKRYQGMKKELHESFEKTDVPDLILHLSHTFGTYSFTVRDMFKDGQRKVLTTILNATLMDVNSEYRHIFQAHYLLLKSMKKLFIPPPEALELPIQYYLNTEIKNGLQEGDLNLDYLQTIVTEMINGSFKHETETLSFIATHTFCRIMTDLRKNPGKVAIIERCNRLFSILQPLSLNYQLWECQNLYFYIGKQLGMEMQIFAEKKDEQAVKWLEEFLILGAHLEVRIL